MPDPSKRVAIDRPIKRRKSSLTLVDEKQQVNARLIVSLFEQLLELKDRVQKLEEAP